jgi:mitogen-activated protein kinase 1/3
MKKTLSFEKRKLSGHVTTRCYRAPEVVLLEKHYHEGVDLWAVGLIMFELF